MCFRKMALAAKSHMNGRGSIKCTWAIYKVPCRTLVSSAHSVILTPAAWASPGRASEMQNLRSHPRITESESTFSQVPQVMCIYIEL